MRLAAEGQREDLLGGSTANRTLILSWVGFFTDLERPLRTLASPNRGLFDELPLHVRRTAVRAHCRSDTAVQAFAEAHPLLRALDSYLAESTTGAFLVGGSLTVADLVGLSVVAGAFLCALPAELRSQLGSVAAWVERCLALPALEPLGGAGAVRDADAGWPAEEMSSFVKRAVEAAAARPAPKFPVVVPRLAPAARPAAAPALGAADPWQDKDPWGGAKSSARPTAALEADEYGLPPPRGASYEQAAPRQGGRNSESFDPDSTLVRPAMRIAAVAPGGRELQRPLKHDDVIVIPEFCCKEDDLSIYHQLVQEVEHLQTQGVMGADWVPWHNGCHSITKRPERSPTFQAVVEQIIRYFDLEPSSTATRFNRYRDGSDWKPFHHDSAAFNPQRAATQNITVGVSFGRQRELAFLHVENRALLYFPQANGTLFSFGRDVNIRWKHGVNALPADERGGEGRISIIVWGLAKRAIEEEGSPGMLTELAPERPEVAAAAAPAPERRAWDAGFGRELQGAESRGPRRVSWQLDEGPAGTVCSAAGRSPWWARLWSGIHRVLLEPLGEALLALSAAEHRLELETLQEPGRAMLRPCYGTGGRARETGRRREAPPDPWQSADPWSSSTRSSSRPTSKVQEAATDSWGGYRRSTTQSNGEGGFSVSSSGAGFFELNCGCTRDEYLRKHIDFTLQESISKLRLNDNELYRLGQRHFQEQGEQIRRLLRDDQAFVAAASSRAGGGRDRRPGGEERVHFWDEDEIDENPFWWRSDAESLCFDLRLTPESDLADGAPPSSQWWDVQKLAESTNFVAISKPAGMFVVTDQRGLWEESPTNFIHVAHRRFQMPSATEPRQRGICHRLDSHTSGVQIFGKSWEAFKHFMHQNGAHRMQKEYIALVIGRVGGADGPHTGVIDVPMKKWQDFGRREFGSVICASDAPSVTKYRVLRHFLVPAKGLTRFWGKDRWLSLVHMRILTGRTHQIRVHMAFLGHPLVGDMKYNPKNVEDDYAIVPRVFLHCLRMEFEEMDGTTFIANSDLASDLQVALSRIIAMADSASEGGGGGGTGDPDEDVPAASLGFPGLAELLRRSAAKYSPSTAASQGEVCGEPAADLNKTIVQRCYACRRLEVSSCTAMKRGNRIALNWRLEAKADEGEEEEGEKAAATPSAAASPGGATWGPDMLWIPSDLQPLDIRTGSGGGGALGGGGGGGGAATGSAESSPEDASPAEELGEDWGALGLEWAWAHDGVRQNGWIRLKGGGSLLTKWGQGRWRLLQRGTDCSPLLLVTFNDVEHALRLESASSGLHGFDMVSKRRMGNERSLAEEQNHPALLPGAPACCATRGWPASGGLPPPRPP